MSMIGVREYTGPHQPHYPHDMPRAGRAAPGSIWRCQHCKRFFVVRMQPAEIGLEPELRWWKQVRWWNRPERRRIFDMLIDVRTDYGFSWTPRADKLR